ncbi:hypothetical protein CSA56_06980 [candidate division KSB3 bacterium]|uniref:Cytotoxic translational repressor of toxin-antitoxin stability system n=1 Tax=candidate division KSB3 bacterium TaxID=2044937 RepID=A0A2G6KH66_9BACT|nr:MAG: hypothetical protein CSA56_06980 [candidate division KSB3 bacterium]
MKSRTVAPFWELFEALPSEVQNVAFKAYRLWRVNPASRGLRFKRVCDSEPVYSVRIGRSYRALGLLEGDRCTGILEEVSKQYH